MNVDGGSVGKNNLVERHLRCSRPREITTQKLSFTSRRARNRGDMSFDRRALWNRNSRACVDRLNQLCCNGLARLSNALTLLESAPKIITRSDQNHVLGRLSVLRGHK